MVEWPVDQAGQRRRRTDVSDHRRSPNAARIEAHLHECLPRVDGAALPVSRPGGALTKSRFKRGAKAINQGQYLQVVGCQRSLLGLRGRQVRLPPIPGNHQVHPVNRAHRPQYVGPGAAVTTGPRGRIVLGPAAGANSRSRRRRQQARRLVERCACNEAPGTPSACAIRCSAAQEGSSTSPAACGSPAFRRDHSSPGSLSYRSATLPKSERRDSSGPGGLTHQRRLRRSIVRPPGAACARSQAPTSPRLKAFPPAPAPGAPG